MVRAVDRDWGSECCAVLAKIVSAFKTAVWVVAGTITLEISNGLRVVGRPSLGGQPRKVGGEVVQVLLVHCRQLGALRVCLVGLFKIRMFIILYITFYAFYSFPFLTYRFYIMVHICCLPFFTCDGAFDALGYRYIYLGADVLREHDLRAGESARLA